MLPHVEDHSSSCDVSSHLAAAALWSEARGPSCRPRWHTFEDGQKASQLLSQQWTGQGRRAEDFHFPLPFRTSRAGLANFDPWTKPGSPSVFGNKLFLAHNHIAMAAFPLQGQRWGVITESSSEHRAKTLTKKCAAPAVASWISLVPEPQLAWPASDLHEAMFQNTLLRD